MTSKTYYFQKPQLEIEQGQIPNNSFDTDQLSLKGGANNNIKSQTSKHSQNNMNNQLTQRLQSTRDWLCEQNEDQNLWKAQKKCFRPNQSLFSSYEVPKYGDSKNDYWMRSNTSASYHQRDAFYNGTNNGNQSNFQNTYSSNKNKINGSINSDQMFKVKVLQQGRFNPYYPNNLKNQCQFQEFQFNYNHNHKFKQLSIETHKNVSQIHEVIDPRKRTQSSIQINKKGSNIKKEQKGQSEQSVPKDTIKAQIEHHKAFFRESDWQRLLFIIQEIILDNNNAIRQLWNFINSYEGKRKYQKGLRIFRILDALGMNQVFDKLIVQEQKFRERRKQKETKIKSLIFALVRRID